MLQPSRFNVWATISENKHVLFNGISGALYEMDGRERALAEYLLGPAGPDVSGEQAQLVPLLMEGGFLIPPEVNEVEYLVEQNKLECDRHRVLDVVIAPTYGCNFRCTYCYVNFTPGSMSSDVENRVTKYLAHTMPKYRQVNLSWFGGEPLLILDAVIRVSIRAREIAERHGVVLLSFISSNGYLLTLEASRQLYEAGVCFFHITVDGPARYHDRLRTLPDGGPTYGRIKQNLLHLMSEVPGAHLTLRMNADETNVAHMAELLDEIASEFRRRIQINVVPIRLNGKTPSPELRRAINLTIRYALGIGYLYSDVQIPTNRKTFCSADKVGNFQIGWDGALYKCSPATDKPEVRVGALDEQGVVTLHRNHETWHGALSVTSQCLECPYICFCAGGCRLERLRGAEMPDCKKEYEGMEDLVINRYLATVNRAFGEA